MIKFILDNGLALGLFGVFLLFVGLGWQLKKHSLKQWAFNLAAVFIAFFLYELYLDLSHKGKKKELLVNGQPAMSYGDYHSELGYAPLQDSLNVEVKCVQRDKILYDAKYGLRNGHRLVPKDPVQDTAVAVFMGGSFTFGEGLDDVETLPAQFNRATSGFFKTLNYAFHGYGPHHALRLMDIGEATKFFGANDQCRLAFYLFIPDHVRRAAGYAFWDYNGPRYELQGDSLVNAGQFSGETKSNPTGNKLQRALLEIWQRSAIAHKHFRKERIDLDEEDVLLTAAIFDTLNLRWKAYHTRFLVILDPAIEEWAWGEFFKKELDHRNIHYLSLQDIITMPKDSLYIMADGHPTEIYNQMVAEYLAKQQVHYLCEH